MLVEVELLLEAQVRVRNPQVFGVTFFLDVEHSQREKEGEEEAAEDDDAPVAEVEPGHSLEYILQAHD